MIFEKQTRLYLNLTKPRITFLCIVMTLGGMLLSDKSMATWKILGTLLGTTLSVSAANAANMYIERDSDRFMRRTRFRPLPMGHLSPQKALYFSFAIGMLSIPIIYVGSNALTTVLSCLAMGLYTFIYTPLKKRTPHALEIGAVPGAIPPLLGWTAIENRLTGPGLALFILLFLWQIPHFIAISDRYSKDYKSAGIKTIVDTYGINVSRYMANFYILILIFFPLATMFFGYQTKYLGVLTIVAGILFFYISIKGIVDRNHHWGKGVFWASIGYLPLVTGLFVAERFF